MSTNELIVAGLPGFILGCILFFAGCLVGPILGSVGQDVLQGSSLFIGLIWAVINIRRRKVRVERDARLTKARPNQQLTGDSTARSRYHQS